MADQKTLDTQGPILNREGLALAVQCELGLSFTNSRSMVEEILSHICEALTRGEKVKIAKFGTFEVLTVAERQARNIRTAERMVVPPHKRLTFNASDHVRRRVARGRTR